METHTSPAADVADKTFDFVIIGGGLAGCVLARRLSDVAGFSVALIEAGKDHGTEPKVSDPHGWMSQLYDSDYDWKFNTVPQKHVSDVVCAWSRGKGLGGSTTLNVLMWNRPAREEIDALERLGNQGWNWETHIKYARKAEKFFRPETNSSSEFKDLYNTKSVGDDGPISISFSSSGCNLESPFQKAMQNNGIRVNEDVLDGEICGTFKGVHNIDPVSRTRASAATGYLYPALGRPNLKVLTEARVNKIIIQKEGGELVATGVELTRGDKVFNVWAKREVLLCAGAVGSPQILELSGIGDPSILRPLGIPMQLELPAVGTNVQDHINTSCLLKMVDDKLIIPFTMVQDPSVQAKLREAFPSHPHPWQLTCQNLSFIPLQHASGRTAEIIEARRREIEKNAATYPPGLLEQYRIQLEYLESDRIPEFQILLFPFLPHLKAQDPTKPHIAVGTHLSHPWARGTIHIASADPADHPLIDAQYLNNDTDLEVLVEGYKFNRKVCQTEPFKSYVIQELLPGPDVQTDEEIRALIKKGVRSTWHGCGSCSMLPRDKGGVVDPSLKVYGTKNLRVVDLSILPLEVSANTQSVVYGIAEQAADIIKAAQKI